MDPERDGSSAARDILRIMDRVLSGRLKLAMYHPTLICSQAPTLCGLA
jgi:hypothetical protein